MSRQRQPPPQQLCLLGAGRLLCGAPARLSTTQEGESAAAPSTKQGDVVGRYLRKIIISRRLRKQARTTPPSSSPISRRGAAADGTAGERADSVARAISYCKGTLHQRGTAASSSSLPRPSLDDWLHGHDRQEKQITVASVTASPSRRESDLLHQETGKHGKEAATTRPASPSRRESCCITGSGKQELPRHGHHAIDKCRREPTTMPPETTMTSSPASIMGRQLRKISTTTRAGNKGSPPPPSPRRASQTPPPCPRLRLDRVIELRVPQPLPHRVAGTQAAGKKGKEFSHHGHHAISKCRGESLTAWAAMSSSRRDLLAPDELRMPTASFTSPRGAQHPRREKKNSQSCICEHGGRKGSTTPNPAKLRRSHSAPPHSAARNPARVSLSQRRRRRLSLAVLRRVRRDPGP
ncbi:unnamed protein product [Urochloa decumbens]|uniref:Uncharacterized protein n=1 Tax=Urochloa decumbens TaxID=240449 RepID=A0ABC9E322_9POAL